jgi:protocatechuate 3,4-dioxygenase beta subunit
MIKIDENTITQVAIDQMSGTPNPRLKQIMESLVKHLHEFAREVDLTPEEWIQGITFLTRVGHTCTEHRQEFILLSDTLGLSSLVNSLHDKRAVEDSTKASLLGPFYRQDAPQYELGESIVVHSQGPQIALYGRVIDSRGKGIPDATVQIWETDYDGVYDLQKLDPSMMDLRGVFHTDKDGNYKIVAERVRGYMIPMDGPVGDMIRAQKRHGYRPAHIHFLISAPGYRELVTALYVRNDPHIDSDTVFGVTDSLIIEINEKDPNSFRPDLPSIHYDFELGAADDTGGGRVGADPKQIVSQVSH